MTLKTAGAALVLYQKEKRLQLALNLGQLNTITSEFESFKISFHLQTSNVCHHHSSVQGSSKCVTWKWSYSWKPHFWYVQHSFFSFCRSPLHKFKHISENQINVFAVFSGFEMLHLSDFCQLLLRLISLKAFLETKYMFLQSCRLVSTSHKSR